MSNGLKRANEATKRPVITQAQCNRAKRWGNEHGYYALRGGWVYTPNDKVVCQGWQEFYRRMQRYIERE